MKRPNRFAARPLVLTGAGIIFLCLFGLGSLFALSALEKRHWLVPAGMANLIGRGILPYTIGLVGCALGLLAIDALLTGELVWGRGGGTSIRRKSPLGFWLGICFQGGMALWLIALGVAMKLKLIS